MTLLNICQSVADEVGILRPVTVISNPDPDAQKLLRYANKIGNRLMKVYDWQSLRKEQTFTAISGATQTGLLPIDFDRMVPETFWNRSGSELITGPVTPVEWQSFKTFGFNYPERRFIYRSGGVEVMPVMAGGETLAFEYISNEWCLSPGSVGQSSFANDADTFALDENLLIAGIIFAYLDGEDLPSGSARADFEQYFDKLIENDQPASKTMLAGDIFQRGGRRFSGAPMVQSILTGYY